jgi:phosphoribosylformylglycinamidine cyclo-ligase
VIGVASSGIHSNGYSLVRKIVFDAGGKKPDEPIDGGGSIGQLLLRPTAIYAKAVREVLRHYKIKNVVHGIAHITGGGIAENIARILPAGVTVTIDAREWKMPAVFAWLQQLGGVETTEMFRVFNMGIGLAMIVSPYYAESIRRILTKNRLENWVIGSVAEGIGNVVLKNA